MLLGTISWGVFAYRRQDSETWSYVLLIQVDCCFISCEKVADSCKWSQGPCHRVCLTWFIAGMVSASYLSPHGIDLKRWSSALGNQNQGHLKRGFPLSEVTLSEVFLVIQRGLVVGTNTLIDLIRGVILNGSDVIRGLLYMHSQQSVPYCSHSHCHPWTLIVDSRTGTSR